MINEDPNEFVKTQLRQTLFETYGYVLAIFTTNRDIIAAEIKEGIARFDLDKPIVITELVEKTSTVFEEVTRKYR